MAQDRRDGSGDERDDRPGNGPDDGIVGADWLLDQLGGVAAGDHSGAAEDAAEADTAPPAEESEPASEPEPARPRKTRWSWQSGTVEPVDDEPAPDESTGPVLPAPIVPGGPQTEPVRQAREDAAGALGLFTPPAVPAVEPDEHRAAFEPPAVPAFDPEESRAPDGPSGLSEPPTAIFGAPEPAGFRWNLTPSTDEPDPLIEPTAHTKRPAPGEPALHESVPERPPAPAVPFEASSPIAPRAAQASSRRSATGHVRRGGRGRSARPADRGLRILLWTVVGLLAVLVLVLLFVLGARTNANAAQPVSAPTRIATASATSSAAATPKPTPTVPPTPKAEAQPGEQRWDALAGRECVSPFTSVWAQTFTVVPCSEPHAAQLVLRGSFDTARSAAYPGAKELASQINLLCSKPGVIDLKAAGSLSDVQVQGAYPANAEQWSSGQRSYFCFVSRASGKPITGSLAG